MPTCLPSAWRSCCRCGGPSPRMGVPGSERQGLAGAIGRSLRRIGARDGRGVEGGTGRLLAPAPQVSQSSHSLDRPSDNPRPTLPSHARFQAPTSDHANHTPRKAATQTSAPPGIAALVWPPAEAIRGNSGITSAAAVSRPLRPRTCSPPSKQSDRRKSISADRPTLLGGRRLPQQPAHGRERTGIVKGRDLPP
jgi:hypothetical protein